jgi:hypothetical protein
VTGPSFDTAQWPTFAAVAVGVIAALSLAFVWRKARSILLTALLGLAIWFVWIRVSR